MAEYTVYFYLQGDTTASGASAKLGSHIHTRAHIFKDNNLPLLAFSGGNSMLVNFKGIQIFYRTYVTSSFTNILSVHVICTKCSGNRLSHKI